MLGFYRGRYCGSGQSFFQEMTLSKYVTHTILILIPKKDKMTSFSELKIINLSNIINKVISRILHDGLESYLLIFIFANRSGLVKGRSTAKKILLAEEIIVDIKKKIWLLIWLLNWTWPRYMVGLNGFSDDCFNQNRF